MASDSHTSEAFSAERASLVRSLRLEISDRRVLEAIGDVPREAFVEPELRDVAYQNRPLPIGHGQTTSQPLMIALMLQELRLEGDEKVLEVGSGCGYQTALLAELCREVVGVELIPSLCEKSLRVLSELGYENVTIHQAGEELGWPQGEPYDAIVVAAAAPRVPQALVDQLSQGGKLVIPVGRYEDQDLVLVEKRAAGIAVTRKGGCRFVPLIGRDAFASNKKV